MLNIRKQKYIHLLNYRTIFLNNNYLVFYSIEDYFLYNFYDLRNLCIKFNIGILMSSYTKIITLFNKNFFKFLLNNVIILYFNEFAYFLFVNEYFIRFHLLGLSYMSNFINFKYLKNISNIYIYYNINYNIFIYIIYFLINIYILLLYMHIYIIIKIIYSINY